MKRLSKERLDSLGNEWLKDVEEKSKVFTQPYRPELDVSHGLVNFKNNCYVNSIIQCIASMKTLFRHLNGSYHNFKSILVNSEFSFLQKFLQVLQDIQSDKKISLDTLTQSPSVKNFKEFIDEFFTLANRQFKENTQNDAHEFLLWLIDILENYYSLLMDVIYFDDEQKNQDQKQEGFIKIFFAIFLNQQIYCINGHETSIRSNELCLNLDIENTESVDESLKNYFKIEQMSQQDALFYCIDCKTKVKAIKTLKLNLASEILLIQLKRFKVSVYI